MNILRLITSKAMIVTLINTYDVALKMIKMRKDSMELIELYAHFFINKIIILIQSR